MNQQQHSPGTLSFSLWGIPVTIQPSVWLVLALLGGAFRISDGSSLVQVLLFVVAGMLCLLPHELGHALVGRYYTGAQPSITLAMMGGETHLPSRPRTRMQYFFFVLAGPLAGLLPGLVAAVLMGLQVGSLSTGVSFFLLSPFNAELSMAPERLLPLVEALQNGTLSPMALKVYSLLMLISVWWCLFNLLPILPMDGGQLLLTATNKLKLTALIGLVLGGLLAVLCMTNGAFFGMILLGYFAYNNWQIFRSI